MAATNPTIDVVMHVGDAADGAAEAAPIAAADSKPKRTARSRELAMLLENITNLAPSPVGSSDSDSSDNANEPRQHLAKSSTGGKPRKRVVAEQAQPSAAAATRVLAHALTVTVSDAAARKEPPLSCESSAASHESGHMSNVVHAAQTQSDARNSCDKVEQQQPSDPLHKVALYRGRVGDSIEMSIMGASGVVYGDIVYADDSSVAAAAVHAGVLAVGETKTIRIYILGPYKGFVASLRNGIKSFSFPKWPGSFAFAHDALDCAAAAAAERKRATQERRAAKKAANAGPAPSDANSSDSDGSRSSSSSDSEPVAGHWSTPAVAGHLQALAESGYVMKYDGEYRRDALKRTSKMVATINLQSISDDVLFMEASGANKRKHIRTKPRRCIPAGAKEVMAFFATDDTKVVPPGDSADPDFLPTPFEYAFEVKDVSKLSKEEDDAESCQVCGCSPCDGVLSCADDSCFNRSLMIECCEETCQCRKSCNNRRFQLGQYSNLRAKRMPDSRGWGLVCTHKLKPGDFCCEYVGERITCSDTVKRMNGMYKSLRHTYLLQLGPDEVIDATRHANLLRFTNHSCNPNCEMQKWNVRGAMRVGLFAIKDIPAGTELCFDYQMEMFDKKPVKCLCGAPNCRGWLGKTPQEFALESSATSKQSAQQRQSSAAKPQAKARVAPVQAHVQKCGPDHAKAPAVPVAAGGGRKRALELDEFGLSETQRRLQMQAMVKLQQHSKKVDHYSKAVVPAVTGVVRKRALDMDEFGLSAAQRQMQLQALAKLQQQSQEMRQNTK